MSQIRRQLGVLPWTRMEEEEEEEESSMDGRMVEQSTLMEDIDGVEDIVRRRDFSAMSLFYAMSLWLSLSASEWMKIWAGRGTEEAGGDLAVGQPLADDWSLALSFKDAPRRF